MRSGRRIEQIIIIEIVKLGRPGSSLFLPERRIYNKKKRTTTTQDTWTRQAANGAQIDERSALELNFRFHGILSHTAVSSLH